MHISWRTCEIRVLTNRIPTLDKLQHEHRGTRMEGKTKCNNHKEKMEKKARHTKENTQ